MTEEKAPLQRVTEANAKLRIALQSAAVQARKTADAIREAQDGLAEALREQRDKQ